MVKTRNGSYRNLSINEDKENCDPNKNGTKKRGRVRCNSDEEISYDTPIRFGYQLRTLISRNVIQKPQKGAENNTHKNKGHITINIQDSNLNPNIDEDKENCDPNKNETRKRGRVGCDSDEEISNDILANLMKKLPIGSRNKGSIQLGAKYICDACNVYLIDLYDVLDHKQIDSRKPCNFLCILCLDRFSDALQFLDHIINNPCIKRRGVLLKTNQTNCDICQCLFYDRDILAIHKRSHEKKKSSEGCESMPDATVDEEITENINQVSNEAKEQDRMKNITMDSSSRNDNDLIKPPFVCTVCREEIVKRCVAEDHLRKHNFSSCRCPDCELQMEIFKILT